MRYDASDKTDGCLAGMLVTSSAYMGDAWFGRIVMPPMSVKCVRS